MGPCNDPHVIKDCNESVCNRCKPILDKHTTAKYPRKDSLIDSKCQTPPIIITKLEINLMVSITKVCNCLFPPGNQTILMNY